MRLKLLLCYQGTAYHGWQIQSQKAPLETIQGVLEHAFFKLTSQEVRLTCSGRTDAGVHALGQVAHCDVSPCAIRHWQKSLNAVLPKDIRVLSCEETQENFHARFDALSKRYDYHFWTEENFLPPHRAPFVWDARRLNAEAMKEFLPSLLGEHDFASFQNTGTDTKTSVRTVFRAEIHALPLHPSLPPYSPELCLTIEANGFLKQMVRNIAGLLFEIGRMKISLSEARRILDIKDRAKNPCRCAPPQGLTLIHVRYA